MLNSELSRVESFFNQKSVLVDTSWSTYSNKSWLGKSGKIISFYRQEADAILSEQQVKDGYYYSKTRGLVKFDVNIRDNTINNNFSYIVDKNNIVHENILEIMNGLKNNGSLSNDTILYDLMYSYIREGYISIYDIKVSLLDYITIQASNAYIRAKSPLKVIHIFGEEHVIKDYHDLDHDLMENEQFMLAYAMKNGLLISSNISELEQILIKSGDDLEYFYQHYYNENLLQELLYNLGL